MASGAGFSFETRPKLQSTFEEQYRRLHYVLEKVERPCVEPADKLHLVNPPILFHQAQERSIEECDRSLFTSNTLANRDVTHRVHYGGEVDFTRTAGRAGLA